MSGLCLLLQLQGDRQSQAEGGAGPPTSLSGFFGGVSQSELR